jgi:hypothetical protein
MDLEPISQGPARVKKFKVGSFGLKACARGDGGPTRPFLLGGTSPPREFSVVNSEP